MRDSKSFYVSMYRSISKKTSAELQSWLDNNRDTSDPVSIATRAMCKYELQSRLEKGSKGKTASPKNKRKAEQIIKQYNEQRKSTILSRCEENPSERVDTFKDNKVEVR